MSQNQEENKKTPAQFDPELFKSLLENQRLELQNKKADQEIRIREIDANTKLAEQSMQMQERYMQNSGPDFRKTITRVAYILGAFVIVILLFLGTCLYLNKDAFAYKFGQGISYLISLLVGAFIGRKTAPQAGNKSKTDDDIQTFE